MNIDEKISELLEQYPAWKFEENNLVGEWKFTNFAELRQVVSQLCELADELNHHPTVTYGYNTLEVRTATHDAGNVVTELDVRLAKRVSQIVGE